MTTLTLTKWEKYFPDIGNNRALPVEGRVYLEVERGLSTRQRQGFYVALAEVMKGVDGAQPEGAPSLAHRIAATLSMHVRYGAEPLKHEGGEVTTLEGYVELVFEMFDRGQRRDFDELIGLVRKANSFGGEDADFFARPSGTAPGTSDGLSQPTV
jgi:hypothetical protein